MNCVRNIGMLDADVILYHGDSWVAKAIRFFDSSEVNHASLYLGGKKVGEALPNGLTERKFLESIKENEYVIIRRLKSYPGTMNPVLKNAKNYLAIGNRYGFEQIVLLAFLGLTRKLMVNVYLQWLLRKVLDEAADVLMKKGKRQPMICSEFVYRCYDEALPASTYTLDINSLPVKAMTGFVKVSKTIKLPTRAGMHSDSLLAWAADIKMGSKKTAFLKGPKTRMSARMGFREEKLAAMPKDELIKNYLQETETKKFIDSTLDMEASLRSAEMLASINNFIKAYYAVSAKKTNRAPEPRRVKLMVGEVFPELAHILDTVANFVTPGDLYKCNNLYHVGKITP